MIIGGVQFWVIIIIILDSGTPFDDKAALK